MLSAKINKLKLQELLNVFFVPNVTNIKRRAKSVCSFKNFKPVVYQPVNLGEARNRWGLDEENKNPYMLPSYQVSIPNSPVASQPALKTKKQDSNNFTRLG